MKKLTIVVLHYKEPWEMCKFLFDSIDMQHGIDFDDIHVMVVNDGDEMVLDKSLFDKYRYDVEYVVKPHGGISDTRNYGIEHVDTEYLMFCDSDDGFLNMYGLHMVLGAIQEGFDMLIGAFVEEQPVGDGWRVALRNKTPVFCHAKAYRRQFLLDKNLRFDKRLYFSEDTVFNGLAMRETDRIKYIETPFYLWAWNAGSTVRRERETLILREYAQVVTMRTLLCEGLKERGFREEYLKSVCRAFADAYCDFQTPLFTKAGYEKLVEKAEREFKKFYRQFIKDYMTCDSDMIGDALLAARATAYESGLRVEKTDFTSWLKHIRNDVKL